MNIRFTIVLVVVLVIFGGAVWAVRSGRSDSESPEREPWLYKVVPEDIAHIAVTHQGLSLSFANKNGQWVIEDGNATPVDLEKWAGMRVILGGPKAARTLSDTVDDPDMYGLSSPRTIVELKDRSGQGVSFKLGDPTPNEAMQYIQVGSGGLSAVARGWGDVVGRLVTKPPYPYPWLSILDVGGIEGMTVSTQEESVSYAVVDGQWVIADGDNTPVDEERWLQIVEILTHPEQQLFPVFQEPDEPGEYGLTPPSTVLELQPYQGDPVTYNLGEVSGFGFRRYIQQAGSNTVWEIDVYLGLEVDGLATDPPYPASAEVQPAAG